MRRVLLVAVVVLAGCNTLGGGSLEQPQTSVTPAPVPEDPEYPPGVTGTGVVDPEELAASHIRYLVDTSYTLTSNRTVRYANGTLRSQLDVAVRLAGDRTYLARAATAGRHAPTFLGRPPANATFWSNGTVYLRALTRDNTTTYNEFQPPDQYAGTYRYWISTVSFGGQGGEARSMYEQVFTTVDGRLTGRSTTDNTTVHQFVGRHDSDASFVSPRMQQVENLTVNARIDSAGVIRVLSIRYTAVVDGEPVAVVWRIRYSDIGTTTVERPRWYQRAVDQPSTSTPS